MVVVIHEEHLPDPKQAGTSLLILCINTCQGKVMPSLCSQAFNCWTVAPEHSPLQQVCQDDEAFLYWRCQQQPARACEQSCLTGIIKERNDLFER